jgi:Phosphopantetheine attachment site
MIARESLNLQTPYELPAGKLEELIAGIFAEVFELDRIGAADESFDVGGDSLLGEVLSERITQRTGQDFQISDLFEHGSPRAIARFLFRKSTQPAMGAGGRPPIFLIHGRVGFTLPKPEFRKVFGESQEFHLFELPGLRGERSYDRLEDIAAVYIAQLVERYPRGPILRRAARPFPARSGRPRRSKFSPRLSGSWTAPWLTCCRGGVPGSCLRNTARSARPRPPPSCR